MNPGEHRLITNLARVGLPLHVADQAIAEIEDSLWLALKLEAHEAAVREQIAREIEAEAETYGSQSAVDTFRIAARIARKAVTR